MTTYLRNDDGDVINPPILPEFEARLNAAHLVADQDAINEAQAEYDDARAKKVKKDEASSSKSKAKA